MKPETALKIGLIPVMIILCIFTAIIYVDLIIKLYELGWFYVFLTSLGAWAIIWVAYWFYLNLNKNKKEEFGK